MSRRPRTLGMSGVPQHFTAKEKLPPDLHALLELLIRRQGLTRVALDLETTPTTIDLVLVRGVKKATRDRLEAALRRRVDAELAANLGAELLA